MVSQLDAVVVGAGPNGLGAALTLAAAGRSVLVLEAGPTPGGGVRSAPLTLPGFLHDVCSAVHPLAVGSPYLSALPLAEHGLEWVHPHAPLAHPLDDGSAAVLHRSLEETGRSLDDARDARTYCGLFSPFVERWCPLATDLLAPLHLPRHPLLFARFGLRAVRPAVRLARGLFRGVRARALLGGLAAHSGLALEAMASASFALVLGAAGHAVGWPAPRGGAQRLTDSLCSLLAALGGRLETDRRIRSLDELPAARAVLLDLDPSQVLALASSRLPPRYRRGLARYRRGPGVFKIDWALAGAIPWRAEACRRAGTVHLGGTLEEVAGSERAVARGSHAASPFVLLAQPSLFDPGRAPAGRQCGWAYCHVPNGSTIDMTERIERQVERFAPGFRDLILARATRTTADLERDNANLVGGDISGGAVDLRQLFFRPVARRVPYATPDRRLFVCSSSTPPGAGVHAMCGHHAALAALRGVLRRS